MITLRRIYKDTTRRYKTKLYRVKRLLLKNMSSINQIYMNGTIDCLHNPSQLPCKQGICTSLQIAEEPR